MINTIRAILAARMATWTGAAISWPNTAPLTASNAPWVRFSVIPFSRTWPTTPAGTKRVMDGEVVVQCFVPSGSGDGAAATLADSVGSHFSNHSASGVQCHEPKAPVVVGELRSRSNGAYVSDGWYQINAIIPWRAEL